RDVWDEPTVHDVDVEPIRTCRIDRAHLIAEPAEVGGQDRRRHHQRSHGATGCGSSAGGKTNRSIASANPSSSLEAVTNIACALTSALALPMAMLRPLLRNISTSFGISPIVAISELGIDKSWDSVATTVPLLAAGWVTSR